jgi:hypothetical protein
VTGRPAATSLGLVCVMVRVLPSEDSRLGRCENPMERN